jgi:hypothetical protein
MGISRKIRFDCAPYNARHARSDSYWNIIAWSLGTPWAFKAVGFS